MIKDLILLDEVDNKELVHPLPEAFFDLSSFDVCDQHEGREEQLCLIRSLLWRFVRQRRDADESVQEGLKQFLSIDAIRGHDEIKLWYPSSDQRIVLKQPIKERETEIDDGGDEFLSPTQLSHDHGASRVRIVDHH